MGKFRRKVVGAFKKTMGASTSRSRGSSSTRVSEPEESSMHEEEETEPTEEQEQPMEEGDNDPHLHLEGDREMQAYNHVKDHEFVHTPAYDPNLLEKIGMDTEFTTIWKVVDGRTLLPLTSKVLIS
jgi:hypothetical protein